MLQRSFTVVIRMRRMRRDLDYSMKREGLGKRRNGCRLWADLDSHESASAEPCKAGVRSFCRQRRGTGTLARKVFFRQNVANGADTRKSCLELALEVEVQQQRLFLVARRNFAKFGISYVD